MALSVFIRVNPWSPCFDRSHRWEIGVRYLVFRLASVQLQEKDEDDHQENYQ